MNKKTITNRLMEHGIEMHRIDWGWLGDAGPGIHILGTDKYYLLPIDDDSDLDLADMIAKEIENEKR